jgi:hypothetical protein
MKTWRFAILPPIEVLAKMALWQWYEKPGYRVPRFYRCLGPAGGGKCLDSPHQQLRDTPKTLRLSVANCVTKSVDTARSAKLASFDKYAFDLGRLGTSSLENNEWQAIMDCLKSLLTKNDGELRPGNG